ncbi:hypothetical protein EOE18_16930 [Novosphingobium umbonatum]|uniref:Esterase n=1 Tax=Novosphingobium umbonatum TaxID=1908524 RepID=A0A3S2UQ16_9SPHN|nr:alpha/beta hydrolase-fold protein [Novosphingobium umbonatum]RVU03219.1 hypothetical protein EOE18_16930 [Novosphingobium umbonatum]
MTKLSLLLASAALAASLSPPAQAQQPPASWRMSAKEVPVVDYTINADHSITFTLAAPDANSAALMFGEPQMGRSLPMSKGADGRWVATVPPVEPDIYEYSVKLDGADLHPSILEVPSNPPAFWQVQDVAHGSVNMHSYYSKVQGRMRGVHVYVPAQYYAQPKRHFPVLYLWAGRYETEWVRTGYANVIADNLIASGKAQPMIIVMGNNTTGPLASPAFKNAEVIEQELKAELMPFIESHYRTINDRAHRATAGLSFGGGTALIVGLRNLDRFGAVAEFGTGVFGTSKPGEGSASYLTYNPDTITPDLYAKLKAPATSLKPFYMSVGKDDARKPNQIAAYEDFKKHGIDPVFQIVPGDHEYKAFRASLADLLPRLFR